MEETHAFLLMRILFYSLVHIYSQNRSKTEEGKALDVLRRKAAGCSIL